MDKAVHGGLFLVHLVKGLDPLSLTPEEHFWTPLEIGSHQEGGGSDPTLLMVTGYPWLSSQLRDRAVH